MCCDACSTSKAENCNNKIRTASWNHKKKKNLSDCSQILNLKINFARVSCAYILHIINGSWKIKPLKINPDKRRCSSGKQPISSHNTLRSKRFRLCVFRCLLSPNFARIQNTENCFLVQKTSRKRLLLRLPQQWIPKSDNTSKCNPTESKFKFFILQRNCLAKQGI